MEGGDLWAMSCMLLSAKKRLFLQKETFFGRPKFANFDLKLPKKTLKHENVEEPFSWFWSLICFFCWCFPFFCLLSPEIVFFLLLLAFFLSWSLTFFFCFFDLEAKEVKTERKKERKKAKKGRKAERKEGKKDREKERKQGKKEGRKKGRKERKERKKGKEERKERKRKRKRKRKIKGKGQKTLESKFFF